MKCKKCGGFVIADCSYHGTNRCVFYRCVICGDIDFRNRTHDRKLAVLKKRQEEVDRGKRTLSEFSTFYVQ